MPEKRPDPSELANSIQHLNGRIDAVLYLVSVVAGTISSALVSELFLILTVPVRGKQVPITCHESRS